MHARNTIPGKDYLDHVFATAPYGIVTLLAADFVIERANAAAARFFQTASVDLIGIGIREVLLPHVRAEFSAMLQAAHTEQRTIVFETHGADLNTVAQAKALQWTVSPILDQGRTSGLCILIVERQNALEKATVPIIPAPKLASATPLLMPADYALFDHAPFGLCVFAGWELTVSYLNATFSKIPGAERLAPGRSFRLAMPQDQRSPFYQVCIEAWQNQQPATLAKQPGLIEPATDTPARYFDLSIQPYEDANGNLAGIVCFSSDVTETVRTSQRFEEEQALYRTLANSCAEYIARYDAHTTQVLFLNEASHRLAGIALTNYLGKTSLELGFDQGLTRFLDEHMKTVVATGHAIAAVYESASEDVVLQATFIPEQNHLGAVASILFIGRDLVEARKTEQALRYQSKLLSTIADAVVSTDEAFVVRTWNEGAVRLYGYEEAEVVGRPLREVLQTRFFHTNIETAINELRSIGFWQGDVLQAHRTGSEVHVLSTVSSVRDDSGKVVGYVAVNRDISKQKAAEDKLIKSELRYRSLIQATNSIVWTCDAVGAFTTAQESWERYTGQPWAAHQGLGWADAIHPEDRAPLLDTWRICVLNGSRYSGKGRIWSARHQAYRHFTVEAIPIADDYGVVQEWVGCVADVHDQVLTQQALVNSEHGMRLLADSMPQLVWIADAMGEVYYYNKRLEAYAGARVDDRGVYQWSPLLHDEDVEATWARWQQAWQTGGNYEIEHRVHMKDGSTRWHLSRAYPERDEQGRVTRWFGTATDIDALKRAEERIHEQNRKLEEAMQEFKIVTDFMPQLVWASYTNSEDGTYFHNQRWEEYTGIPVSALQGAGWLQVLHPDDVKPTYAEWNNALAGNRPFQIEYRLRNKNNEYRWHLARAISHTDETGKATKWYGTTTDIHDQKLAEESLKLQARVLESMDEGVSISDAEGFILYTNQAEDRMFGYETGELVGKHVTVQNAYDEADNRRIVAEVMEQLRVTGFWNGVWHNRKKDGTTFFTYAHISALPVGDRNVLVCVQRDITKEREANAILDYQNKLIKTITDSASSALLLINEAGICTFMNPAGERMFGYSVAEVSERPLHDLIHYQYEDGTMYPKENCIFYKGLRDKHYVKPAEDIFFRKDGSRFHAVCSINPIWEGGQAIASVVEVRDITDQKNAEKVLRRSAEQLEVLVERRTQDLIRANEMLERSNRELEQYAYIASHDLQEPLRKIRTFTDMLLSKSWTGLETQPKEILQKINASAERMTVLITDLLNFSRITHETEQRSWVNINEIVRDILTDLELSIEQKGAQVLLHPLPSLVAAPLQMRQLFYNLLNNALKFTMPGRKPLIFIFSRPLSASERMQQHLAADRTYQEIIVADNGIGFEPQYAAQIFEIFKRLHDRQTYSGTGIGLALVRKIVTHHGGTIYATGNEGSGASFHIILPVE